MGLRMGILVAGLLLGNVWRPTPYGPSPTKKYLGTLGYARGTRHGQPGQCLLEFPGPAFLMQIVLLLYDAVTHLYPSHRKHDLNQWADELTHPDPEGFSPSRRTDFSESLKSFSLLPLILPYHNGPIIFNLTHVPVNGDR